MIFFKNNEPQIDFIIDMKKNYDFLDKIKDLILEFFVAEKQVGIFAGKKVEFIPISGMAKQHSQNLCGYLNDFLFQKNTDSFAKIIEGRFGDFPMTHHWLTINEILIDPVIAQFVDKPIPIFNAYAPILSKAIFISDNIANPIYQMHKQN